MGFNTVAVLYNDFNFATFPAIGHRIAEAMRGYSYRDRDPMVTHFSAGMVISQAHADYSQVVVVGRNTGGPIVECNDLDYYALGQIADALLRHGWTVKPPAKPKSNRAVSLSNGE